MKAVLNLTKVELRLMDGESKCPDLNSVEFFLEHVKECEIHLGDTIEDRNFKKNGALSFNQSEYFRVLN